VPRYLLDTDICIYIRRAQPAKILSRFERLKPGDAAISVITYGELAYGAAKSATPEKAVSALQRLIEALPMLPLPSEAGVSYGYIRAALAPKGRLIGPNDLWIAAHALAAGLILVTNNEREFRRVKDLKIENWAAAG
jgi:tRNA(fMet)-specific endonuclease VapC